MFSLSALVSALLGLLARTFSNVIVQEIGQLQRDAAQRQIGADRQASASLTEAERQEARARADGTAAADGPDDERDLRP